MRFGSQQLDAVFVAFKLQLINRSCKPEVIFNAGFYCDLLPLYPKGVELSWNLLQLERDKYCVRAVLKSLSKVRA